MNGPIIRNQYGAFCAACQSQLSLEEDDWDECDACGGEGLGEDDEDMPDDGTIEESLFNNPFRSIDYP